MNRVRFHRILLNRSKLFNLIGLSVIVAAFVLSGCSESITPQNETSLAFVKSSNNESSGSKSRATNEPDGQIISPTTNVTVNLGDDIYFAGSAYDPTGNYPLSFHWDFGQIQPNSLIQNPGFITMTQVGTFRIALTASNTIGVSDPNPDFRIIEVIDPNAPNVPNLPTNPGPIGSIVSPVGNLSINVGESLFFMGAGNSPAGFDPISFFWNFAGSAPNSTQQTPGNVTFNQAGVFPIQLTVTDTLGQTNNGSEVVMVTVNANGVENVAPTATIISPPGDLTIKAGESIYFTGSGNDIDSNEPLAYFWDFSGGAPASALVSPGKVTFTTPGVYIARLTVTDVLGLSDLNPPVRIITVSDVAVTNEMPLNDVIISPAADLTVMLGETVNFQGEGNTGGLPGPLRYLWHFEHMGMPPVTIQNPGDVLFDRLGEFEVELVIGDANGNVVSHEVERRITVVDPNALQVHIHEPATNQTINVGDSILFQSMIINDPLGSPAFNYNWSFDRAAADSMLANPEPVTFNFAGEFKVRLRATDPLTGRIARAEPRIITVVDPTALQARIVTPMANQTINVGDVLNFAGEAFDPLGTATIEYMWRFNDVVPNMAVQNPGDIAFNVPGKFEIKLFVRDSTTLREARSNTIRVTVQDPNSLLAEITSPANDMLLYLGESVNYTGIGIDPLSDATMLSYNWKFGRGDISSEPNPGIRTYDMPGDYEVKFHVDDPLTNRHSNKVEREIHVMPIASPSSVAATVNGTITSPMSNMTVTAGSIVVFEATGSDPAGRALMYHWNFNGSSLNSTAQNPGAVMLGTPGIYTITLTVKNDIGEVDPTPAFVIITVL